MWPAPRAFSTGLFFIASWPRSSNYPLYIPIHHSVPLKLSLVFLHVKISPQNHLVRLSSKFWMNTGNFHLHDAAIGKKSYIESYHSAIEGQGTCIGLCLVGPGRGQLQETRYHFSKAFQHATVLYEADPCGCSGRGSSCKGSWKHLQRDSPGKNTGVGCHFLLQGICLTQGSNLCILCLLHWQIGSSSLAPLGKPPIILPITIATLHMRKPIGKRGNLLKVTQLMLICKWGKRTVLIPTTKRARTVSNNLGVWIDSWEMEAQEMPCPELD